MTRETGTSAARTLPRRLLAAALLLLVATGSSACSWLTGEFATLDRLPPSCGAERDGALDVGHRP